MVGVDVGVLVGSGVMGCTVASMSGVGVPPQATNNKLINIKRFSSCFIPNILGRGDDCRCSRFVFPGATAANLFGAEPSVQYLPLPNGLRYWQVGGCGLCLGA